MDAVEEHADQPENQKFFVFRHGGKYYYARFIIKSEKPTLQEDTSITLGELRSREVLNCMSEEKNT